MVELGRFALQAEPQAAHGARVGRRDPPSLAPPRQPKPLVRVVAAPEIDLVRAVLLENPFDHVHRQQRAERQLVEPAVVRELVDHGASPPHDPELGGGRHAVDMIDAHAQGTEPGREPDQFRHELRERLGRFPARRVDGLIIGYRGVDPAPVPKRRPRPGVRVAARLRRLRRQVLSSCEGRSAR